MNYYAVKTMCLIDNTELPPVLLKLCDSAICPYMMTKIMVDYMTQNPVRVVKRGDLSYLYVAEGIMFRSETKSISIQIVTGIVFCSPLPTHSRAISLIREIAKGDLFYTNPAIVSELLDVI